MNQLADLSVFDVIGPRMIGPSSSHTAGAARLAQVAGKIAGPHITDVVFTLYGSFSHTSRGHGSDRALVAGILGMGPDDERLRSSFSIAKERGLRFSFEVSDEETPNANTVRIQTLNRAGRRCCVTGVSVGGGAILITEINGVAVELAGEYPTVILEYVDKPGIIAAVSTALAKARINIAFMRVFRHGKGRKAFMVVETDQKLPAALRESLRAVDKDIAQVLLIQEEDA